MAATLTAEADVTARAQRAVKNFNKMSPQMSAFAKMLTGNPKVRVLAAKGTPCTDGDTIFMRPPIELGAPRQHDRLQCDKRDHRDVLLCDACRAHEDVIITLFHEVGHIAYESFQKVEDADRQQIVLAALKEASAKPGGRRAEKIAKVIEERRPKSYVEANHYISRFLPIIFNAIEDARVNIATYKARPGTYKMFRGQTIRIFEEGIQDDNGEYRRWCEAPRNAQIIVGLYCKSIKMDYTGWFIPEVEDALNDAELTRLLAQIDSMRNARDVYRIGFPVLECLRGLGFCKAPDDVEDEEEQQPSGQGDPAEEPSEDGTAPPEQSQDADGSASSDSPDEDGQAEASDDGEGNPGEDGAGTPKDMSDVENDSDDEVEVESDADMAGAGVDDDEDAVGAGADDETAADAGAGAGADDDEDDADTGADDDDEAAADSDGSASSGDDEGDDDPENNNYGDKDADGGEEWDDSDGSDTDGSDNESSGMSMGGGGGVDGQKSAQPSGPEFPEDGASVYDDVEDENPEPEPDLEKDGDADAVAKALRRFGNHQDASKGDPVEEESRTEVQEVERALVQSEYFDQPSVHVHGVNIHRYDKPIFEVDGTDRTQSLGYSQWSDYQFQTFGASAVQPDEKSLSGPLQKLRIVFSENKRASYDRNRRSGKVNAKVLGRRVAVNDDRLFQKKREPGKRDYFVVIGIDISGSTMGRDPRMQLGRIGLIKSAALAQAELLHRLGVKFALYAHTAHYHFDENRRLAAFGEQFDLDMFEIKRADEAWNPAAKKRLADLTPASGNLDGHTLEFYRKRCEESQATEKIIMYYTDGEMPATNYTEEKEILEEECRTCEKKGITLMGVGVYSNSPTKYGMNTVRIDAMDDLPKVITHLEKQLEK